MSYQRLFVTAIAEILLQGDWQPKAMAEGIYWLLQEKPSWVIPLVNRVYTKFAGRSSGITKPQLITFIVEDRPFLTIWSQQRHLIHIRQFNLQQTPASAAKLKCDIPVLTNIKDLSVWLGLNYGQLENYAAHWRRNDLSSQLHHRHYHYHWKQKKSGQQRLIEAPKQRLANVQRQIHLGILAHVPLHESCHGFRKEHSCQSYVKPHSGKAIIIRMDLDSFFSSIPLRRIHALFVTIGYHESIARQLAGLCCNQTPVDIIHYNSQLSWQQRKQLMAPHLPQGSPSSPVLANVCAYKLDLRLTALAGKLGGSYTRYADDLAFSGDEEFVKFAHQLPVLVAHIAMTEGFSINHRKTNVMHQGVSQRLTGMTLNDFPNYPRKQYDQLKSILYNCVKFDPQSQNRHNLPFFKQHLQGKIAFVRSLNPVKAQKLTRLYERIDWIN